MVWLIKGYLFPKPHGLIHDAGLVEGFKHEQISKIVLYREEVGKPLADMLDQHVIAVASDKKIEGIAPLLDINQPETIAGFIVQWLKQTKV